MIVPAVLPLAMTAELRRDLVVRVATVPDGNRELHCFKIKKRERWLEAFECTREIALDQHAAGLDRAPLAIGWRIESDAVGEIVNRGVALRLELRRAALQDIEERADVVLWKRRPAAREEGALVWLRAVGADGDVRERPREHRQL